MSYGKIINGYSSKEEQENHQKVWGGYNDPLPNMKEISAEEFSQGGFFTWCITGHEFRQIDPNRFNKDALLTPVKYFLSVKIFYLNSPHEDGFAMSSDYWGKQVRYFKFARCFHNYREISKKEAESKGHTHFGNCYHVCECLNCGQIYSYDSSG